MPDSADPHYAMPRRIPAADTRRITRKLLDLPYADRSPAQRLDLYLPEAGAGPFPLIISIHGGAFMGGDKGDVQLTPMLRGLERGYAVASINYRMSGEATFPALVHDARAAARWLRANAARHQLDPNRFAAWGGSAGGYLAAMLGLAAPFAALDDPSLGSPDQSSAVQAVVDWFGPTNFLLMDEQLAASGLAPAPGAQHSGPRSPESLLLGAQITTIPARVQAANPENYVHPAAPPFLIQHGLRDDTVPYQQSQSLAEVIARAAGPDRVQLDLLPTAGHGAPEFSSEDNVTRVLDFLDETLGR